MSIPTRFLAYAVTILDSTYNTILIWTFVRPERGGLASSHSCPAFIFKTFANHLAFSLELFFYEASNCLLPSVSPSLTASFINQLHLAHIHKIPHLQPPPCPHPSSKLPPSKAKHIQAAATARYAAFGRLPSLPKSDR